MSAAGEEHEYGKFDAAKFDTPYELLWAEQAEEIRVVDVIRAVIPRAAVFFHQGVVSVRATDGGASRDVVLMPGDRFTVTATTVIRRGRS